MSEWVTFKVGDPIPHGKQVSVRLKSGGPNVVSNADTLWWGWDVSNPFSIVAYRVIDDE